MSAINVRDLKRTLEHLVDEALVVVISGWEEREIPLDSKWFFFDERSKRLIIRGPLVYMDKELEHDLRAIGDVRARIRGWERGGSAAHVELLRDISELLKVQD